MSSSHPIRLYRTSQTPKVSQAELGRRVGVTRFTVMRWEEGSPIDEDKLPRVARETGIPAKELRPDLVQRLEQLVGSQ